MKEIINLPVEHYIQLIKDNKPFSFSRFGDGEILCMFHNGWLKKNCDGSHFTDDLIEPMKQIFRNKYDYYHCFLNCTFVKELSGDEFKNFIKETCPDMSFYWGELWYGVKYTTELFEALSLYNPCFIGGKHIENLKFMIGLDEMDFIETPSIDAFEKFSSILESIKEKYNQGSRMFCFCAGYSTKILIDTLFPIIGHDAFMIDFGSAFDPYCGKLSRSNQVTVGFEQFQPYTRLKLV
jgi:hypothetical protein